MRFLVIGCGSIGKRHIRNLLHIGQENIVAFDVNSDRIREIEEAVPEIRVCQDIDEAYSLSPEVVFVCTPSSLHIKYALQAAGHGCHLFIEKPLSHNMEGVDELISLVKKNRLMTLLGCNWKFHPSFKIMKQLLDEKTIGKVLSARVQFGQYLPDWHPWEDYRQGYSAKKSLGGGILLDSHEFDYIRWFLGETKEVFCFADRVSELEIDTEDTAEVLLRLKGGGIVEIHLDYTQRSYQRAYEFYGDKGTIIWDFNQKIVRLYSAQDKNWSEFPQDPDYPLNEMYIEEMKHLIGCLEGKEMSIMDIYDAKHVLQVILTAKESALTGKAIQIRD